MSEIFQLFECGDVFQFTDPADSYQTWQGLQGPKGDPGEPGPPGADVQLRGPVPSTSDLPATAPSGEIWLVGAAAPYDGWFYNGTSWEDAGEITVGPQGPPGEDGQDGADGAAATIAVGTVSGLPAGSTPTVINTGTSAAAIFDFGIPEGDQGETGPAGPGVPASGTTGQYLKKSSGTDYDTEWADPSSATPLMDGTASAGSSMELSRADHVHPHDTASDALYLTGIICSALTGDIASYNDARITADHLLVFYSFQVPYAVPGDFKCITTNGNVKLNGTCEVATKVDLILVKQ